MSDLAYLLECVETHADKFPAPAHMRSLVDRIRATPDVDERLRLWIWEQRDKHGDVLEALGPAFDLILNKIDEFRDEKGSCSA